MNWRFHFGHGEHVVNIFIKPSVGARSILKSYFLIGGKFDLPYLVFSSTEVYLTFYTRGLQVGNKYDLKLMDIENSMETEFPEALEIINGVQGALKMQIDSQARLLVGETGTITVSVQNSGDTDVVAPIMVMEVSGM